MSEPTDIKALDEYLKGNSEVAQRYRELGRDEVPPELDRRVLAAARAAVASPNAQRSRSWLRWSAPVALAASVVLVVTVVIERGGQDQMVSLPQSTSEARQPSNDVVSEDQAAKASEESKRTDEVESAFAAQAPAASQPHEEQLAKARPPTAAKAQAERESVPVPEVIVQGTRISQSRLEQAVPVAVIPEAPPVAPPVQAPAPQAIAGNYPVERKQEADSSVADSSVAVQEVAVTGARSPRAVGRTAGPRNTISSGSFRARPAADNEGERSDPQAWLEDIRAMRRAGKNAEADREWQRFHEAFPKYAVADDDLARKKP